MTISSPGSIISLLRPSGLSAFISITTAVLLVGAIATLSGLKHNTLQQEVFAAHTLTAGTSAGYHAFTDNLARNEVINNMPLFIFWLGVGCIVYFFAVNIFGALTRAVEMERSLGYVHANRRQLIQQAFEGLVVRLISLVVGVVVIRFLMRVIFPYSLELTRTAAKQWQVRSAADLIAAVVLLVAMFHIITIILRLVTLRSRVLGSSLD